MKRGRRAFLVTFVVVTLCVVAIMVGYPELLLSVLSKSERRSAGLERRIAEIDNHRIVYLDGGSGPPVVLLHGFGLSKDQWNLVAAQLTPSYRVIAPDLPGFGESSFRETESYDLASQAMRLRAFLDALGVGEHHLGGNSMGAAISVAYATRYPMMTHSLLISAAPGVRSPEKSVLEQRLAMGENPLLVRDRADLDTLMGLAYFRPPLTPSPLKRAILATAVRRQAANTKILDDLTALQEGTLEPFLPRIQARTLVLWGEEDQIVHPSSVPLFTGAIERAESEIFDACGHALPRECPGQMAQRYRAFLESRP